MRIKLTSIMVDAQDKALRFYTEILRFQKKHDKPARWLSARSGHRASTVRYQCTRRSQR